MSKKSQGTPITYEALAGFVFIVGFFALVGFGIYKTYQAGYENASENITGGGILGTDYYNIACHEGKSFKDDIVGQGEKTYFCKNGLVLKTVCLSSSTEPHCKK